MDLDCAKPFIGFCSALTCDACTPHNNRLISIRMHAQAGEPQYTMCASLQVFEKITCLCVGMLCVCVPASVIELPSIGAGSGCDIPRRGGANR